MSGAAMTRTLPIMWSSSSLGRRNLVLSTNFELNEPVGIQGRAYRVADFHYFGLDADPIVEFRRLTDGTALFLASDRIWDMALRNKIPSFRQKRRSDEHTSELLSLMRQ